MSAIIVRSTSDRSFLLSFSLSEGRRRGGKREARYTRSERRFRVIRERIGVFISCEHELPSFACMTVSFSSDSIAACETISR